MENTQGYVNGIFTYNVPVPNYPEFAALYDYWRIGGVEMKAFYSCNVADSSTPAVAMPLLLIDNDYDDVDNGETVSSMLERSTTRYVQIFEPIKHRCKPNPVGPLVVTSSGGGVSTPNSAGIYSEGQWLNSNSPGIRHNGIKIVWNTQGRTTNVDIGTITFSFKVLYEFKGVR